MAQSPLDRFARHFSLETTTRPTAVYSSWARLSAFPTKGYQQPQFIDAFLELGGKAWLSSRCASPYFYCTKKLVGDSTSAPKTLGLPSFYGVGILAVEGKFDTLA